PGSANANGVVLARIALGRPQTVDTVTLHMAHSAGIVVGPYRHGAVLCLDAGKAGGDFGHRLIPGDALELRRTLRPGALQWVLEAVGVMDALGVTVDFLADDAGGVGIILGAAHPTDRTLVHQIDVQRAGRRTIVRADGADSAERK